MSPTHHCRLNPVPQPLTPAPGYPANQERFLRNRDLVDQEAINRYPVAIIGVGAIGSQLAEQLARLGVHRFTLLDPDVVDEVNLSVQGFGEDELGLPKAQAVAQRLGRIRHALSAEPLCRSWIPGAGLIAKGSVIIATPDSIGVRRELFEEELLRRRAPCLLDARMSAEAFECYCIPRDSPEVIRAYQRTLFPRAEAHRERCTARATIYCAALAAACLCAMFKRWTMRQSGGFWHSRLEFSSRTFDLIAAELQFPD